MRTCETTRQTPLPGPVSRRLVWRAGWFIFAWMVLCAAPLVRAQESQTGTSTPLFRMGFSSSLFKEMNENDIKVFLRTWTETLAQKHGMPADPQPILRRP